MLLGADISVYQDANSTPQRPDFVKCRDKGAKFIFIRAAYGIYQDEDFSYNWNAAKEAGLPRGAYLFWRISENDMKQAELICNLGEDGEMPVVIDVETNSITGETLPSNMKDRLLQVVDYVHKRTGKYPIIYTGYYAWREQPDNTGFDWSQLPLWLAWYGSSPLIPEPWKYWTFWQYTSVGDGIAFGMESKGIDLNYFYGEEKEFNEFLGKGTNTEMGTWSQKAHGLWISAAAGKLSATDLKGYDYVIIKAGGGNKKDLYFSENIQAAYDAQIPCFMFWENDPELYIEMTLNPDVWAKGANDVQMKVMDECIFSGGVKRAIHGIILDCSKVKETNGNYLTNSWISIHCSHMLDAIWKRYGLPVYLYMNMNPISVYPNDPGIVNLLIGAYGTSTVSYPTIGADGFPVDGAKPVLPYDGGQGFYFWFYKYNNNKFGGSMDVLYRANKASLYNDISYAPTEEPSTPEEPTEPEEPDTPPTGEVDKEIADTLNKIAVNLEKVLVELEKLVGHLGAE